MKLSTTGKKSLCMSKDRFDQQHTSAGERKGPKDRESRHAPEEVEETKHLDDDAEEGVFEEDE